MAIARIHGKKVGSNFSVKNAINVALSAISGMSARNVQEGIEEVHVKKPLTFTWASGVSDIDSSALSCNGIKYIDLAISVTKTLTKGTPITIGTISEKPSKRHRIQCELQQTSGVFTTGIIVIAIDGTITLTSDANITYTSGTTYAITVMTNGWYI